MANTLRSTRSVPAPVSDPTLARGRAVYLIHLDHPIGRGRLGQAQHYLGSTRDLTDRILRHARGRGARLMEVAEERGILWSIVRTWPCSSERAARELERRLKARKNGRRLCPVCKREVQP